jgi:hypothetical protein
LNDGQQAAEVGCIGVERSADAGIAVAGTGQVVAAEDDNEVVRAQRGEFVNAREHG